MATRVPYPIDPSIEQHLFKLSGAAFGAIQRLQTYRGIGADRHLADWMRLSVIAGFYDGNDHYPWFPTPPADGRFFMSRPEYSIGRNHINADYTWNISDATALLADTNYDTDSHSLARGDVGLAVVRSPRLRYYVGMRYIDALDVAAGTVGVTYHLSRKYIISAFEQYDFDFEGGQNVSSSVSIVRKFPRWYMGLTFAHSAIDESSIMLTIWPEGVSEVRIGSNRLNLFGESLMN